MSVVGGEHMEQRYVIYKGSTGEWRWHLVAANNRVIAVSAESYNSKADCLAAVLLAKRTSSMWSSITESHAAQGSLNDVAEASKALSVFLCHASGDKPRVKSLYDRLLLSLVEPWLDEENLLPGQDWNQEIRRAVRESDVVIVCVSQAAINKAGYLQKEIRYALDAAEEQPEGTIFLIPLRLEECDMPERLSRWHWVDLFEDNGYEKLIESLRIRSKQLSRKLPYST